MTTKELTTQMWRDYEYCCRVIESCQTQEQLQVARQLALVNTPQRWRKLAKQRPLTERLLEFIFGGLINNRIDNFSTILMHQWWKQSKY